MSDYYNHENFIDDIRNAWKQGSKCEIYSDSTNRWYEGEIVEIFTDDEHEWLKVQYNNNSLTDITRFHSEIRPKLIISPLTKRWILHHYVVHGYIRQNCVDPNIIPTDIMKLIHTFYSLTKTWNVSKQMISPQKTTSVPLIALIPTFKIYDMEFQCRLFPNGFYDSQQCGYFQFELMAKFIPKYIKKIKIYFELLCISTQTMYRGVKVYKKTRDGAGWNSSILKLSKCMEYDCLNLICYLDILYIQYKKHNASCLPLIISADYFKPIKMQRNVIFNFERNSEDDKPFEVGTRFMSETFGGYNDNNCWWLTCDIVEKERFRIMLKLFRLPLNMSYIKISYNITNGNGQRMYDNKTFDIKNKGSGLNIPGKFKLISGNIKFAICIDITDPSSSVCNSLLWLL